MHFTWNKSESNQNRGTRKLAAAGSTGKRVRRAVMSGFACVWRVDL
jgi:hypothetical protein